jgi:ribose 5-phosphate isomerase B
VRVAIASDHAGFALKEDLKRLLDELRVPYDDLGPATEASVDYPDFAAAVAHAVRDGRADRGVLVCGTGIGMSIAANKIDGIRAALLTDEETARLSREHNDANVMTVGGRTTPPARARAIVRVFLATEFVGGRHARRVGKIASLESSPADTGTDHP